MRFLWACLIGLLTTIAMSYVVIHAASTMDFSTWAPKTEVGTATQFMDRVASHQFGKAMDMFPPSVNRGDHKLLEQVASLFPNSRLPEPRVVNWVTTWKATVQTGKHGESKLVLWYTLPDKTALQVMALFVSDNGNEHLYGVNFSRLTAEQTQGQKFDLQSLSSGQLITMLIAIAVDVFSIATFIICMLGPLPSWRTRWLWMIATLIGVFRINVVWATGQVGLIPVAVLLPPASLSQMPIGSPWVVAIAVPLGALVYWSVRRTRGWDVLPKPAEPFSNSAQS